MRFISPPPGIEEDSLAQWEVYASFNPAPRLPRNSTPLAVSIKADPAWLSVGPT
jgi:hypothetical protein